MKLSNPKWEAFCWEFARTGKAAEAYRNVYKPKSTNQVISQSASRLSKNEKIKARVAEISAEIASEKIASVAEIQERLTRILRGEEQEEQIIVEGCGDGISQGVIMKRKPQLKDVIKAGETLAKMQGGFDNNVSVKMTVPVICGENDLED